MAVADPDTPSSAYLQMLPGWDLLRDIRIGAPAVRAVKEYLPQFTDEDDDQHQRRVKSAPFTNFYDEAVRAVAAKPFARDIAVTNVPPQMESWLQNIDLLDNNLTQFARELFDQAADDGIAYILVDFPRAPVDRNLQEERDAGARPFFRLITATDMLAVYDGHDRPAPYMAQARFQETSIEPVDFTENVVRRIRRFTPGETTAWVQHEGKWQIDGDMSGPITMAGAKPWPFVPIVPVVFGQVIGSRYHVKPPFLDLGDKVIEHYRHASRLDEVFNFAGFPILTGNGLQPAMDVLTGEAIPLKVGPRAILYAPGQNAEYKFIEPSSQSIREMREHLNHIEEQIRNLSMQPHLPRGSMNNVTATASAIGAARAHSMVQAWAYTLQDALKTALTYMGFWSGNDVTDQLEVSVHTDFAPERLDDKDEKLILELMATNRISHKTGLYEMQRRDVLSSTVNIDDEIESLVDAGEMV